jgi:ABC-type lipoprotein release transport system permease subunit
VNAAGRRWARHLLRRRAAGIVLLTVLVALAGGAALTALIGAHRSVVVVDETMDEHLQPDVMSLPSIPNFDWRPITSLPYVEAAGVFAATPLCLRETGGLAGGPDQLCTQPPISGGWYSSIWKLDILEGRLPTGPNEIAINRKAQQKNGWKLGDRFHLEGTSPKRLNDYWGGKPKGNKPWGPTFVVTVTGVFAGEDAWRVISGGVGAPGFLSSTSFWPTYGRSMGHIPQAFIRLRGGEADIKRLRADITKITGDPAFPIRDVREAQRRVERSTRVEAVALAVFAAAVLLAGAVLLGQALVRLVGAGTQEARTLRSLGMAPASLIAAMTAPGVVIGVLGGAGAVAVGIAASSLVPIGIARTFDRHPGTKVDAAVLVPGGLAIVALVCIAAFVAAAFAIRRQHHPTVAWRDKVLAPLGRLPLPPSMALGVRMALERRTGADSLIRTGLVGATVGVLAVVAAITVRHGISDTVSDPGRAGKTWELAYYPELSKRVLLHDHDIAAAAQVTRAEIDLDGVAIPVYAIKPIGKPIETVMISGRRPERADEIALGPSTASVLHADLGDTVQGGSAGNRSLRVVGTALLWEEGGHAAYDEGGWVTTAGFARLHPAEVGWQYDFIHVHPGVDLASADKRLLAAGAVESPTWPPPAAVRNLNTARNIPVYLGILLAALGTGAVGYAIVATARRRRDLAILRALGMSRRSARAVVAWHATTIGLIGLAFGIPLGIVTGRLVWQVISDAMPLKYVAPGGVVVLFLIAPVTLLLVNLAALWPARAALHRQPAAVLRTE